MLRVILVLFEGFSGLHINWRKSHLYPINEVHNMEALNAVLGGEGNWSIAYIISWDAFGGQISVI